MAELGQRLNESFSVRQELRGYALQTVPPELREAQISVSALAHTICTTHRDIYLAKVQRIKTRSEDRPWQAEAGSAIHKLLQQIHNRAKQLLPSESSALNTKQLLHRLISFGTRQKKQLLASFKHDPRFSGQIWPELDRHFDGILFLEAIVICTLLTYKVSKKTILETGVNIDPTKEFEQLFSFSAIEHRLSTSFLGLSEPVTPDFLYRHHVIGDIKTGAVHEDDFRLTCTGYALAYEAEYGQNIDFGLILHVGFSNKHFFPIYQGSHLYEIDDKTRQQFILLRDQKLKVIAKKKEPPVQNDEQRCRPCQFYSKYCWVKTKNA
jgi:CRISPR/Cas system-associated exonuclease Cas4 (RecB family)